jgi:hypothetical protein
MRNMRNWLSMLFFFLLLICCGEKRSQVKRTFENGVEIVINHLEPYKIVKASSLTLEETLKIDTERADIVNLGLTHVIGFEVNSLGEIFFLGFVNKGNFIFKFDGNGKFVKSFGSKGEGPGELQNPSYILLDSEDHIVVFGFGRYPLNKYDNDGLFLNGHEIARNAVKATSGPKTNLLVLENSFDPANSKQSFSLKLLNSDLKEISVLDGYSFRMERAKFRAIEPIFCWSASCNNIYVANEDNGYEIWVYDIQGKLVRKIRKEYRKIPISESDKKEMLNHVPKTLRNIAYFPECYPPVRSLVAGDDGMLLVSTFEKGNNSGDFMLDIFNKEGVFIGRKSLNIHVLEGHLWACMRGNKFYCLREKDSGYLELVVYNMK